MQHNIPRPTFLVVMATQLLLGLLFLLGIGVLLILPSVSTEFATMFPEYAELRLPLLTLAVVFTLLALATVAVVAFLVQRIRGETMLTRSSLHWVSALVSMLLGAVTVIVISFFVISEGQAGSTFLALSQAIVSITLLCLACITLVLRSLLSQAISLRAELDEVV